MIIITGGSSGIGKSITEELLSKGEKIITISRSENKFNPNHYACDICDYNSLKKIYKKLNSGNETLKAIGAPLDSKFIIQLLTLPLAFNAGLQKETDERYACHCRR